METIFVSKLIDLVDYYGRELLTFLPVIFYTKMTKLEKLCFWKKLANDPDSTTFQDVEKAGIRSPLYRCIKCPGDDYDCSGYKIRGQSYKESQAR